MRSLSACFLIFFFFFFFFFGFNFFKKSISTFFSANIKIIMSQFLHGCYSKINRKLTLFVVYFQCYGPTNHKVPLAVLHSLLLFRRIYNRAAYAEDNYWSHMDLSLLIAQFKMVIALSNSTRGVYCKNILCQQLDFWGFSLDPSYTSKDRLPDRARFPYMENVECCMDHVFHP